ncbi:MAG: hypothetical protein IPM29_06625 [Planctomycetes bacterium]|nr:hypothetical protein [Planctomycetota bacterium]
MLTTRGLHGRPARTVITSVCLTLLSAGAGLPGAITAQAPRLLLDALPGAAGSMTATSFAIAPSPRAGEVYLALDDGVHGAELWRSDGTLGGTSLVVDLTPGPAGTTFWMNAQVDGLWLLVQRPTGPELWRSDGTATGTARVLDAAGLGATTLSMPQLHFADGSFVLEIDGELARSDGTAAGTRRLGVPAGFAYDAGGGALWVLEGGLREVWFSDGRSANGQLVATGVGSVAAAFGGLAIGSSTPAGGTTLTVLGVTPAPQATLPEPVLFWKRGDAILAFGTTRLWSWNGIAAPVLLGTFAAVQDPIGAPFFAFAQDDRSTLFFPDDGVHGHEPWWTDGTPAGTRLLADLTPGPASTVASPGFTVEGHVVFWAFQPSTGNEPWTTDGTPVGTTLLGDLEPGPDSSFVDTFSGAGGIGFRRVVLPITTSAAGNEPWVSDGTPAGTRLLGDVNPGPASSGQPYAYWTWHAGTTLIVALDDGSHGFEPFAIDFAAASAPLLGGCSGEARYLAHDPVLGTPWRLEASHVAIAGAALVAAPAAGPSLVGPTCSVQLDLATSVLLATIVPTANGEWTGTYPLPSAAGLVGLRLVTQAAFLDPTAPLGVTIGHAWFATLGL